MTLILAFKYFSIIWVMSFLLIYVQYSIFFFVAWRHVRTWFCNDFWG